jgi:hypothetical protein
MREISYSNHKGSCPSHTAKCIQTISRIPKVLVFQHCPNLKSLLRLKVILSMSPSKITKNVQGQMAQNNVPISKGRNGSIQRKNGMQDGNPARQTLNPILLCLASRAHGSEI